jgi:hypothetical protein
MAIHDTGCAIGNDFLCCVPDVDQANVG